MKRVPTRVRASISATDPRKMAMKQMLEKHTLETVELEDELNKKKIQLVNEIIGKAEEKKNQLKKRIQTELRLALQNASDTDDKNAIVMKYAQILDKETEEIEESKENALREMMERLADEIVEKKTALRKKHLAEIDAAGLSEEVDAALPQLRQNIVPCRSQITEDLEKLARQQEILAAEMKKYLAEDKAKTRMSLDDEMRKELDKEMEERCKRITALGNNSRAVADKVSQASLNVKSSSPAINKDKLQQNMRQRMMKKQKERRRKSGIESSEHLPNMENEFEGITEDAVYEQHVPEDRVLVNDLKDEIQLSADLEDATLAVLEAIEEFENDQIQAGTLDVINRDLRSVFKGETDELISIYKDAMDKIKAQGEKQKNKCNENLQARLLAKKKMREELFARQQKSDSEATNAGKIGVSESGVYHEVEAIEKEIASSFEMSIRTKQEELLRQLDDDKNEAFEKLKKEEEMLAESVEQEEREKVASLESSLDSKAKNLISGKTQLLKKELEEKENNLNADEKDRFLKEHEVAMRDLKETMDKQKSKQVSAMKSRLAERRQIKEERLKAKREAELKRLEESAEVAQMNMENTEMKEREAAILGSAVNDMVDVGQDAKAQALIHHQLSHRHVKEKLAMERQQKAHLETAQLEAEAKILEDRDQQRDELCSQHESELASIFDECVNLSPEVLAKKEDELRRKHMSELNAFDERTSELIRKTKIEVSAQNNMEFAHQKILMKQHQLMELSDALKNMTGDEEMAKRYAAEAKKLTTDAEEFRQRIANQTNEKMKKLKDERLKKEAEIKEKMQQELKMLEKDLEEETKRHQLRQKEMDKQNDLLERRKLVDREKEMQNELRSSAEKDKDEILAQYENDVNKIKTMMRNEKEKSSNKLKEQLEARRKKRKDATMKKIEEKKSQEILDLEDSVIEAKTQVLLEGAQSLREIDTNTTPPEIIPSSEPQDEGQTDLDKMFENTVIFKQLSSIEEMLGLKGAAAHKDTGKSKSRPYLDLRDAQWKNAGTLQPADVSKLSPCSFVTYRFGLFLTRLLKDRCGFPKITVLLADSLPQNNYQQNAYRHSYYFDPEKMLLFIRKERTESVGEFMIVIVHALAHVHIKDMREDTNPFFLRHFYRGLRVICTDMFFGRASQSPLTAQLSFENAGNAFEYALGLARSSAEKYDILTEMIDLKVHTPSQLDFSPQELASRLEIAKDASMSSIYI